MKLSIALEEPVALAARRSAERQGVSLSAWLNEASRNALRIERGRAGISEWEEQFGLLNNSELIAADAVLDAHGVGRSE